MNYRPEDRGHHTPCWIWQGFINRNGYGDRHAHRRVYEEMVGPIPTGLDLDHLCRVRACVNPAHLEPVTRAENARRGDMAKLSKHAAAFIKSAIGRPVDIAHTLGVSRPAVHDILKGRSWVDLEPSPIRIHYARPLRRCRICGEQMPREVRASKTYCDNNCRERARRERLFPGIAPYQKNARCATKTDTQREQRRAA